MTKQEIITAYSDQLLAAFDKYRGLMSWENFKNNIASQYTKEVLIQVLQRKSSFKPGKTREAILTQLSHIYKE